MRIAKSTNRWLAADWMIRGFWLALVAVHIAPLLSLVQQCRDGLTLALTAKILGIALSMGLFGAKAAGARILRVHCRWTAAVVFAVCCSLAHPSLRQELYAEPSTVVAVAAVAVVTGAARRRVWPRLLDTASGLPSLLLRSGSWQKLMEAGILRPSFLVERASTVPRGPPMV